MDRRKYFKKKISTDGESSSDEDDIISEIFKKYSKDGVMKKKGFAEFISKLKEITEDNLTIDEMMIMPVFYFLAEDKKIDYKTFKNWWFSETKYEFFSGKRAALLFKAWDIFIRYAEHKMLDVDNFLELMKDLKINATEDDFNTIDYNQDGKMDFREFCEWLQWF